MAPRCPHSRPAFPVPRRAVPVAALIRQAGNSAAAPESFPTPLADRILLVAIPSCRPADNSRADAPALSLGACGLVVLVARVGLVARVQLVELLALVLSAEGPAMAGAVHPQT